MVAGLVRACFLPHVSQLQGPAHHLSAMIHHEEKYNVPFCSVLLERLGRRMIADAMPKAGGIQTRVAELLGISERVPRYELKKCGLSDS